MSNKTMRSTYQNKDVTLLLKDITGLVTPLGTKEREALIQAGVSYSEMLPLEYKPSPAYMDVYFFALSAYAKATADATAIAAEKIYARSGSEIVLVSLARAGIPIGILLKRYLERKYEKPVFHYSLSIIRDRGIDKNAMNTILSKHLPQNLQFVDGWIGKGTIQRELEAALCEDYPEVSPKLAVLSDPANLTDLCGTHEDILIPNSCLNSTVSGLISRTFLRKDIIGPDDYHGAVFYEELLPEDQSEQFLTAIESHFDYRLPIPDTTPGSFSGLCEVKKIAESLGISNINFIKSGIGEATRVLLRRMPWCLLLRPGYENDPLLTHLVQLAREKQVPIREWPLQNYRACGIIRKMADV